jgi:hypothetical protein
MPQELHFNVTIDLSTPYRWCHKTRMIHIDVQDIFGHQQMHWFDAAFSGKDRSNITIRNTVTNSTMKFYYYSAATTKSPLNDGVQYDKYRHIAFKNKPSPGSTPIVLCVWQQMANYLEIRQDQHWYTTSL